MERDLENIWKVIKYVMTEEREIPCSKRNKQRGGIRIVTKTNRK